MSIFFFTTYLPTVPDFKKKYSDLVIKYPDINKFLYITSIHKVLSILPPNQQKELIVALENSEELAQKWIQRKPELTIMLTEHLERNILAMYSKLV